MEKRFAADERDPHRAEIADFADPNFEVLELRMRLRVIVLSAIGAIEIAFIGEVEAALQRLPVEKALAGFEQVVAGKFAADFIEQVHEVADGPGVYEASPPLSSHNVTRSLGRECGGHRA